jgi:enterochelin esterase-like enzyme
MGTLEKPMPTIGDNNISEESGDRAIAGLSMGGRQSIETGIVHLGYFEWIGAFSPAVSALFGEFEHGLTRACDSWTSSLAITMLRL